MASCKRCGTPLEERERVCPACGTAQRREAEHLFLHAESGRDESDLYRPEERREGRVLCVLSYIPLVSLLVLLVSRNAYMRFHANQGLVLTVSALTVNVLFFLLGLVVPPLSFVALVCDIGFLSLVILGIVHAVQQRARELPLIGGVRLIKTL